MFSIPEENVDVAFVDKAQRTVTLTSEQELQGFYKSSDCSSEDIKFIVQNRATPDGESLFSWLLLRWVLFAPAASSNHNHLELVRGFQYV